MINHLVQACRQSETPYSKEQQLITVY